MLLLSPMTPLLMGLLLAAVALAWHRRMLLLVSVVLVGSALVLMTPLVANALVGSVESRAEPRAGDCDDLQAVVFLSGGVQHAPDSGADVGALTADTVARVFGLLDRGVDGELPLVISGGGPFTVAESDVVASLMSQLGIGGDRVLLEPESRTTWDSAQSVRRLLPPSVRRIALASSALHLPRSTLVYRAAGFEVCQWPLGWRWQEVQGAGALLPQSSGLLKSEAALHELVGALWYRLRLATQP